MKPADHRRHPSDDSAWSQKLSKPIEMNGDVDDRVDVEDEAGAPEGRAGWRCLFNFTGRKHMAPLLIATILSILSGFIVPAVSIFAGKLFSSFTDFGGGKLSGNELVSQVSIQCVALVALGGASWALNGGYFMFWLVFGELQAQSARNLTFDGLMEKDMAWYDMRRDGIGAMIPRLQK